MISGAKTLNTWLISQPGIQGIKSSHLHLYILTGTMKGEGFKGDFSRLTNVPLNHNLTIINYLYCLCFFLLLILFLRALNLPHLSPKYLPENCSFSFIHLQTFIAAIVFHRAGLNYNEHDKLASLFYTL